MPTRPSDAELDEFLTRGMAEVIVREDLAASLRAGDRQLRIKQGFDPTHPNLHLCKPCVTSLCLDGWLRRSRSQQAVAYGDPRAFEAEI